MAQEFAHAFSEFTLGKHTLKNRLVALPAGTSMVDQGLPNHADVDHFERLASGGVGMLIAGASIVDPSSFPRNGKLVGAHLEGVVEGMSHKADVVHEHGALLVGQLAHLGRETIGAEYIFPPVAVSPSRTPRDAYPAHILSKDEISKQVDAWALSAKHFYQAGLDGIEIHAAHGYLVAQFLSELTNARTDKYGGDFSGRARFLDEIIEAMRAATDDDFLIGVRLSAEEEIPGGMGLDDCLRVSEHLAASDQVGYLNITHGVRGAYVKDATQPDGVAIPSAARVREVSGLPVIVGQRIRDAATADHIVKTGKADLVGMARALIADPDLPNKSWDGRLDQVRGCLGINQDCRAFDPHLHCAVNAEIGRGRHPGRDVKVKKQQEIFVVGAGPGGLEAARIAAERGHKVTVFDRNTEVGGSVRIAARSPHRSTLIDIVDYLEREAKRLKVGLNLGAEIGVDDLDDLLGASDKLIIATGSQQGTLPTQNSKHIVLGVDDVLLGHHVPENSGTAMVYDESDGFWPAYSAAEALASAGWNVHFVTAMAGLGARLPHESVGPVLRRLGAAGAQTTVTHQVFADSGEWKLQSNFGGVAKPIDVDLLVIHRDRMPVDQLVTASKATIAELDGEATRIVAIGDCVTPRRISHAIAEGYRVGAEI